MSTPIYIGIDPGKKGGICIIEGQQIRELVSTPTVKKGKTKLAYNTHAMAEILRVAWLTKRVAMVALEKVHAMPKQGVSSTFDFGRGYGLWEGMITMLGLPLITPPPATWMKTMHAGIPGDDSKGRSVIAAQRLLPGIDLTPGRKKKPDDGLADAALLAIYARRTG